MRGRVRIILITAILVGSFWVLPRLSLLTSYTQAAEEQPNLFLPNVQVAEPTDTVRPTLTPTKTKSTATPTSTTPTATSTSPTQTPTMSAPTATTTPQQPGAILEPFEDIIANWKVTSETTGGGTVSRSDTTSAAGSFSARMATGSTAGKAFVRAAYTDAAANHTWEERPGTWHWQRASIYLPASTANQLGDGQYITLAGMYPSAGGSAGWYLRVKRGGALAAYGYTSDGAAAEVASYGNLPLDQWVEVEVGLHTQAGPGVKRAFAFLVNGQFYGWYRQGRMANEIYDRASFGIISTNSNAALELYVDQWGVAGTNRLPTGSDARSTAALQEQDFRNGSGIQAQYDWSTWKNQPVLSTSYGLYPAIDRIQAGRNIDRMPDLSSGWAEIEIDWPSGTPPQPSSEYFGPMVGFRKEVNREENLEVIPWRDPNGGKLYLVFEAWVGKAIIQAKWPLPDNSVPAPGDIIRARWEEISTTQLNVRASYYDASAGTWNNNIISGTYDFSNVPDNDAGKKINYMDGYHTASSITIDSTAYSIRRFKVGTLDSYPGP